MREEDETLAIMKGLHVGLRDVGKPVLWFTTYINEHAAALQVLDWAAAGKLLQKANVEKLEHLEGSPCWVKVSGSVIQYVRPWDDRD